LILECGGEENTLSKNRLAWLKLGLAPGKAKVDDKIHGLIQLVFVASIVRSMLTAMLESLKFYDHADGRALDFDQDSTRLMR
jgi:hypothetical protein